MYTSNPPAVNDGQPPLRLLFSVRVTRELDKPRPQFLVEMVFADADGVHGSNLPIEVGAS